MKELLLFFYNHAAFVLLSTLFVRYLLRPFLYFIIFLPWYRIYSSISFILPHFYKEVAKKYFFVNLSIAALVMSFLLLSHLKAYTNFYHLETSVPHYMILVFSTITASAFHLNSYKMKSIFDKNEYQSVMSAIASDELSEIWFDIGIRNIFWIFLFYILGFMIVVSIPIIYTNAAGDWISSWFVYLSQKFRLLQVLNAIIGISYLLYFVREIFRLCKRRLSRKIAPIQ
jgi:hypothetical protein